MTMVTTAPISWIKFGLYRHISIKELLHIYLWRIVISALMLFLPLILVSITIFPLIASTLTCICVALIILYLSNLLKSIIKWDCLRRTAYYRKIVDDYFEDIADDIAVFKKWTIKNKLVQTCLDGLIKYYKEIGDDEKFILYIRYKSQTLLLMNKENEFIRMTSQILDEFLSPLIYEFGSGFERYDPAVLAELGRTIIARSSYLYSKGIKTEEVKRELAASKAIFQYLKQDKEIEIIEEIIKKKEMAQ